MVGARNEENVNPDNRLIDQTLLGRPGTRDGMVDLLEDMKTNAPPYPARQAALRAHQPTTLILWGDKEPLFVAPGAEGLSSRSTRSKARLVGWWALSAR